MDGKKSKTPHSRESHVKQKQPRNDNVSFFQFDETPVEESVSSVQKSSKKAKLRKTHERHANSKKFQNDDEPLNSDKVDSSSNVHAEESVKSRRKAKRATQLQSESGEKHTTSKQSQGDNSSPNPQKLIPVTLNDANESAKLRKSQERNTRTIHLQHNPEVKQANQKQLRNDSGLVEPPTKPSTSTTGEVDDKMKFQEALERSKLKVEELEKELETYKNTSKEKVRTNECLEQEIIGLDKKKQTLVTEFHQYYRRANNILRMQSKLEEKIKLLAGFLANASKLKETIRRDCTNEARIKRRQAVEFFSKCNEEMENTKQSCLDSINTLQATADEFLANEPSESESPMVDVEKCIALCGEKQNLMQTMLNDLRLQITKLEAESADMGSEKTGTKEKILVLAQQMQSNIELERDKVKKLKNQATKEISVQREIISSTVTKVNRRKAKIEEILTENRILQEEIDEMKLKKEENEKILSSVDLELEELNQSITELNARRENEAELETNTSSSDTKSKEFEELTREMLSRMAQKKDLSDKLKQFQSIDDRKNKLSQLQNELTESMQRNQKLRDAIGALENDQQGRKSKIDSVKKERDTISERIHQALSMVGSSQLKRKQTRVNEILETAMYVSGKENSLCDVKEREISSVCGNVCQSLFSSAELELQIEQIRKENDRLDGVHRAKEAKIDLIAQENKKLTTHRMTLQKFVMDGSYTTRQELNKSFRKVTELIERDELKIIEYEKEIKELESKLKELTKDMEGENLDSD